MYTIWDRTLQELGGKGGLISIRGSFLVATHVRSLEFKVELRRNYFPYVLLELSRFLFTLATLALKLRDDILVITHVNVSGS